MNNPEEIYLQDQLRKTVNIFMTNQVAGILIHGAFFGLFLYLGVPEMAWFNIASTLIFIGGFFLIRREYIITAITIDAFEIILHAIAATYFLGLDYGFQWPLLLCAVGAITISHPNRIYLLSFTVVSVGTLLAMYFFWGDRQPVVEHPAWLSSTIFVTNLTVTLSLTILAMERLKRSNMRSGIALVREHQKSEALLLNILPSSIANRLKDEGQSIADGFSNASVLFADIVGFTKFSQTVSPDKLVSVLNELFSIFDDLVVRYRLEKIKTIGDSYMVAAGIPEARPDHAQRLADFALEMRNATSRFRYTKGILLEIRIGINSGPVVAGVIGKRKFIYDLWGDAVNTASRMESHGSPGEVHISESTYELIKDSHTCHRRGEINVKGKGKMTTYWLTEKESAVPPSLTG